MTLPLAGEASWQATCEAGEHVLSGGYSVDGLDPNYASRIHFLRSAPFQDPASGLQGWSTDVVFDGGPGGWTVTASAICAPSS